MQYSAGVGDVPLSISDSSAVSLAEKETETKPAEGTPRKEGAAMPPQAMPAKTPPMAKGPMRYQPTDAATELAQGKSTAELQEMALQIQRAMALQAAAAAQVAQVQVLEDLAPLKQVKVSAKKPKSLIKTTHREMVNDLGFLDQSDPESEEEATTHAAFPKAMNQFLKLIGTPQQPKVSEELIAFWRDPLDARKYPMRMAMQDIEEDRVKLMVWRQVQKDAALTFVSDEVTREVTWQVLALLAAAYLMTELSTKPRYQGVKFGRPEFNNLVTMTDHSNLKSGAADAQLFKMTQLKPAQGMERREMNPGQVLVSQLHRPTNTRPRYNQGVGIKTAHPRVLGPCFNCCGAGHTDSTCPLPRRQRDVIERNRQWIVAGCRGQPPAQTTTAYKGQDSGKPQPK